MCQALMLSVLVWLSIQGSITCIRIREMRVPAHVAEGSEVVLGCMFELQGHRLFSVKWLKDGEVFYHYRPGAGSSSVPDIRAFSDHGVSVDAYSPLPVEIKINYVQNSEENVARSSMEIVTLVFMGRESAGEYRCEVTGEGPLFRKDSAKKNITVDLLPDKDPQVTGLKEHYKVGTPVELNCSSTGARPASRVQWFVNNMPAPRYHVDGPWYSRSLHRLDAFDTTVQLKFGVLSSHFIYGVMTLRCEATVAPLYRREVVFKYHMQRTRDAKLVETTTKAVEKTTEKPCDATITVELADPPEHFEPWSINSETTSDKGDGGGANFVGYSLKMLYFCILIKVLL